MTDFPKYLNTLDAINHRSADAIISHARIDSPALNQALRRRFSDDAHGEGFLAEPVFEEQKVWKPGALDMREIGNEGILRPELVQALDRADSNRVPMDRRPYEHQLSAWRTASSGSRSYMVSRAIQRHVHLGYETQTDIFELQLFPLEQADDAVAWAIGSALREALSLKLGIQAHDEIGVAVQNAIFADGVRGPSILLFDRAPGGAGFSTLMGAPGLINELLKKAAHTLECNNCTDGCPECILRPDLQHDGTPLDRVGALDVLLTCVMDRLIIPENIRVFGEKTELVSNGAYKWLLATARTAPPDEITFFLHGPRHSLDLTEWRAIKALRHFPESCQISIAVPDSLLSSMEQSHKRDLLRVLSKLDAKLVRVASAPVTGGLPHLLEATNQGITTALATTAPGAELIGERWGKADAGPVISGEIANPCEAQMISVDKLLDFGEANAIVETIHEGLNGTVQSFGKKFWTRIKSLRPQAFSGSVEITELLYSDRYVKSPLTAALALSVLTSAPKSSNKVTLKIVTTSISYGTTEGWNIWDNWSDNHARAHVISEIAPGCTVLSVSHKECPHERRLIIGFSNGSRIDIRLDQGFGAWSAKGPRKAFPFDQAPKSQANQMMKTSVEVELRHAKIGTPFSLTWRGAPSSDSQNK
jgi:DEAD/DEAH box helicase domain-containing protein